VIPDLLRRLLEAHGPSGYEQAPAAVFRDACAAFAEVEHDTVGSTVARVPGTGAGMSVAVVGHVDEIGLIVHHIDDDGFLWFTGVGGWDPQVLAGQRVVVSTQSGPVPGLVGRKPIHLLKGDARKQVVELEELHIDIGARDGEDARARVALGDVAVIDAEPVELAGERIMARALDNRVGCFVAAEVGRRVAAAGGARGDLHAVAVTQEEIEFGGSTTTAFSLAPHIAVIVDATWATDQPGVEERKTGRFRLGDGAVITRGATLHPALFSLMRETAEEEGIPHTVEVTSRSTRTDADAFAPARAGIPSTIVSVPMRYLHSPAELIDMGDVEAAIQLIVAFAQRVPEDLSLLR
jgi:putative aminopeptidase FrvX